MKHDFFKYVSIPFSSFLYFFMTIWLVSYEIFVKLRCDKKHTGVVCQLLSYFHKYFFHMNFQFLFKLLFIFTDIWHIFTWNSFCCVLTSWGGGKMWCLIQTILLMWDTNFESMRTFPSFFVHVFVFHKIYFVFSHMKI